MNEKELKIMDTSLKLFVERGFHGTSTAEIARNAGVATGTLFHYFKTKEDLINHLYLYSKESLLGSVSGHYNNAESFQENIKRLWLKLVYFGIQESNQFQFILSFHCSPYITSLTKRQVETKFESVFEAYKIGLEKQEIKEASYEMLTDCLWGNVVATVNHFERYPERFNEKTLNLAFELFWGGISK
ncbi:TetR/AcrR family transcriptional regulator [Methanobacterium aggregans]|uniref:TetR/AcrR family transcriptional regulator n=1 Tax=Methanobacterium aggregans TaxID=1615586 RepID=UPI001AEA22B0|nr:TetR/AcrR family transcriptional regulator [Methanobacterium aggregans]MBP2045723.1 AcrR family transcriptional regulator [Methanobacterium aggregans]